MIQLKTIEELNSLNKGTMMEWMQLEYLEAGEGYLKARIPVDERTFQPMKILHGGASLALAETVAGLGSALIVDLDIFEIKGAHVSANHIGSTTAGFAIAEGRLIHKGKNTHVWNVEISDDSGRPISTCRITNFLIKK
jgi:uncharacterized protein (TIGR00369 family)